MNDVTSRSSALIAAAQMSRLTFLQTELQVANTLLDVAAGTRGGVARERRRAEAREACAVVARHLTATGPGNALDGEERERLSAGVSALVRRLTPPGD
jgi:hypothetical protein